MNIHVFGKERSVKKMKWIAVSPKTGEGSKDFPGWVFTCNPAKVNWPHSKALMYKLDEEIVISKGEIKGKFKSDLIENQNLFDKFLKKIKYNEIRGFENTMTEFIIAPVKNPVDVLPILKALKKFEFIESVEPLFYRNDARENPEKNTRETGKQFLKKEVTRMQTSNKFGTEEEIDVLSENYKQFCVKNNSLVNQGNKLIKILLGKGVIEAKAMANKNGFKIRFGNIDGVNYPMSRTLIASRITANVKDLVVVKAVVG